MKIIRDICIVFVLQTERDISVRQRAIDLLYAMCDRSNAKTIVEELLLYLENADYSIRETLVSASVGLVDGVRWEGSVGVRWEGKVGVLTIHICTYIGEDL